MKFKFNKPQNTGKKIRDPEKLMWVVLKRNFPFLFFVIERDRSLIDDINQSAQLAFYATGGDDFKEFWNYCQRELYSLSKAIGFRRTKKNKWIMKEIEK